MIHAFSMIRRMLGAPIDDSSSTATVSIWQYIIAWFFGALPSSFLFAKLQSLWPPVELQIGPEHTWIEKRRRLWLTTALAVGVLPVVVDFGWNCIKKLFG